MDERVQNRSHGVIDRRTVMKYGAGAGVAVAAGAHLDGAMAAGGQRASASLRQQGAAPVRGGELIVSDEKAVASLDPHYESVPDPAHSLMFDRLIANRPTGNEDEPWAIEGELAESWEFAPDGLSMTFALRPGVVFHDGSPWNAEAAKWNFDRIKSDLSVLKSQITFITGAEAVDDMTLKLTFSEQTASPALLQIASVSQMVSKAAVEEKGDEEFGRSPVGTGPCKFVEWIPDDSLRLERNPDYWRKGDDDQPLPYFDTIKSLHAVDLARASVELRSGNIMAYQFPPARDIPTLMKDENVAFITAPATYRADLARVMINMNAEPFTDLAIRQAAFYALDEAGFANAMGPGIMEPHHSLWWAPGVLGYDESIQTIGYDPDKAKQLLADAGHPDGIDIVLTIQNRTNDRQAAQILKQMWDQVGLRTEIEAGERVTFNADLAAGKYQVAIIGTSILPDPESASSNFTTGGLANWGKYSNPEVDNLVLEGRRMDDRAERAEIYKEIQRIINADAGLKILARHPLGFATSKRLQGVTSTGGSLELRFASIAE
ncbi:MAG: ABC transporter substrate-binding protein [Thermomicrobiales bacterium]